VGARELDPYGIHDECADSRALDTEIMGGRLIEERKASMSAGIPRPGRAARGNRRDGGVPAVRRWRLYQRATIQLDGGKHMH
jgi:hypothetical protein